MALGARAVGRGNAPAAMGEAGDLVEAVTEATGAVPVVTSPAFLSGVGTLPPMYTVAVSMSSLPGMSPRVYLFNPTGQPVDLLDPRDQHRYQVQPYDHEEED